MSITVTEHGDSGRMTDGRNEELVYLIEGMTSNIEAMAALKAAATSPRGALVRDFCRVEPVEGFPDTWTGYAPFILPDYQFPTPQESGEVRLQFEVGGGQTHFDRSISQVASYPEAAPHSQLLVNVDMDGEVKGADIDLTGGLMLTYTSVVAVANINTYMGTLHAMRQAVSSDEAWHGLHAGEAIFVNASGGERADGDYQMTHRFAARPNETGITIGSGDHAITGIACDGWDYADVRYGRSVEGVGADKALVAVPTAVYIHRLFKRGNFAAAFGF